jgi:hypothetical protein
VQPLLVLLKSEKISLIGARGAKEKEMANARLIKKQELINREQEKAIEKKPVVKKKMDAVVEWLGNQRTERKDPRKAFDALFVQPQTQ